jgi:hypothetical protein
MKKFILLLSLSLIFGNSAFARDWYFDGGLGLMKFDDGTDSVSPTNLYLRGGYQFNKYFNVGLESNFTVSPDQVAAAPGVDFDVDTLTFYGRAGVPVNRYLWVYGQLGRTNAELTANFSGNNSSEDNNDTMYGVGAEIYPFKIPAYIALNYSSYNDNGGVKVTAFNLGVGYRF